MEWVALVFIVGAFGGLAWPFISMLLKQNAKTKEEYDAYVDAIEKNKEADSASRDSKLAKRVRNLYSNKKR